MKTKFIRSYRSEKGNVVFVYSVSGTDAQLEQYKAAQGVHYREDEKSGQPMWFTTRCIGKTGSLIITSKGKVVADMSEFELAKSLVEQYGGNFGETLAKSLMANLVGGSPQAAAQVAAAPAVEAAEETDLDNL